MAYSDQKMSGGKIGALAIVVVLHIALAYAFITGLALNYVKKAQEKLNTFDVAPPPPPPPDVPPPPPPPDTKAPPPPVVSPPPIVKTVTAAPPIFTTPVPPPPRPIAPPAPPPPPAPPAISKAAGLKGNPAQFFGADNYPPAAIRAEAQGRVTAKLSIGTDGRVTDCSITSSSGNGDLDQATCRISKSRVRFTPAQDSAGNPIASSYPLAVRWVLPSN